MRSLAYASAVMAVASLAGCGSPAPLGSGLLVNGRTGGEPDASAPPAGGGGTVNGYPPNTVEIDAGVGCCSPPVGFDAGTIVVADAGVVAEAGVPAEAGVVATDALVVPEGGIGLDAFGDAAALESCSALAAAGAPARLSTFQWQYEVGQPGPLYGRPYDTVSFDAKCAITYQKTIFPVPTAQSAPKSTTKTVTMSAVDCAAARGWATNARFLEVLRTGDGCPYGMGNPDDVFDLNLTDEGRVARKTYLCPEPTLEAVRACLRPLVARLFPG
jgi:hypothetical protein